MTYTIRAITFHQKRPFSRLMVNDFKRPYFLVIRNTHKLRSGRARDRVATFTNSMITENVLA